MRVGVSNRAALAAACAVLAFSCDAAAVLQWGPASSGALAAFRLATALLHVVHVQPQSASRSDDADEDDDKAAAVSGESAMSHVGNCSQENTVLVAVIHQQRPPLKQSC